jgi:hypothetical protein
MDKASQDRISKLWAQAAISSSMMNRIAQEQANLSNESRQVASVEMSNEARWLQYFASMKRVLEVGEQLLQAGSEAGILGK